MKTNIWRKHVISETPGELTNSITLLFKGHMHNFSMDFHILITVMFWIHQINRCLVKSHTAGHLQAVCCHTSSTALWKLCIDQGCGLHVRHGTVCMCRLSDSMV